MTVALKKNIVALLDERSGSKYVYHWFYLKILLTHVAAVHCKTLCTGLGPLRRDFGLSYSFK